MRNKASTHNKFVRFITLPIRALGKAKDIYVQSLTSCAAKGRPHSSHVVGRRPSRKMTNLPKSFSVNSIKSSSSNNNESEDLRELMRAASARTMGPKVLEMDTYMYIQEQMTRQSTVVGPASSKSGMQIRSCSVGMDRIEEEKDCDFGELDDENIVNVKADNLLYPRSKTYAVTKRNVVF